MSEWISVDDWLPPKGKSRSQWYIFRSNGDQGCAWFDGSFFSAGSFTFKDVTHWAPLMQSPEVQATKKMVEEAYSNE